MRRLFEPGGFKLEDWLRCSLYLRPMDKLERVRPWRCKTTLGAIHAPPLLRISVILPFIYTPKNPNAFWVEEDEPHAMGVQSK